MTSQYCSSSGSCGSYRPTGPGIFDIDNLTQNALKIFDWKEQIRTALITYGNYASIMVLIHLTWKLIINNRKYQNQEERCDKENHNQVKYSPLERIQEPPNPRHST